MNGRLQNRCLITSAVAHIALAGLLLLSAGFKRSRMSVLESGIPLELVPGDLADSTYGGPSGGQRAVAQPVPAPAVTPHREPPRQADPPRPAPQEIPPAKTREQRSTPDDAAEPIATPQRTRRERTPPATPATAPGPDKITFDFSKAQSTKTPARQRPAVSTSRSSTKSDDRAQSRLRSLDRQLATAVGSLAGATRQSNLSIQISPGGGGGGAGGASVNALNVRNAYDAAWITPSNVTDERATTEVEIVIRGDGSVVSARIVQRSGIDVLDRSVEDALRKVTRIQPFETSSADEQFTFTIGFNLQSQGAF